ncbi:formylglycine-generating enzyme family protein [Kitasatospora paracochleata]|uniref:Formylglycine-generating enzyme required for sulfatase activity n=1 Tax=Kitasatospora paracochleata TaxID=58354 RepID=A0ABT1IVZ8_9ACTN|nr:formylglycine-generating enzyme family protein [Kitasatospora paracochleata]MCP2309323.1 formylglycine-generating enzyme required for sulfatase activity [Kitasatospora paracochleata]
MTTTAQRPSAAPARGVVWIPGGSFLMGSEDFYPEERPVHPVSVDGFWMDEHPVTVAAFRRFVKATGYVTVAERPLDPADYPGADPAGLVPGALVFHGTRGPVDLDDWRRWWSYVPGASWRHPQGAGSTLNGRERHPVTQVAHEDARAYAAWAGKDLPTEAEWEYAARGGLAGAVFPWGDDVAPRGRRMANTWHGRFPWEYLAAGRNDPGPGTSPVGSYPPNGYGLYDMAGNVWEWTADHYTDHHPDPAPAACCAPRNPRVDAAPTVAPSPDLPDGQLPERFPRRVTKGGSHLCAPNYCLRYRPAARQGQTEDTATCHLGFRCVMR